MLGCSDARAPIERIFDQSLNDLFVIRVAGNVLGVECLGSIDYAVNQLGASLKLLVVLGHSTCGAVSAAVNSYLAPKDYASIAFTHSLRSLVDRIQVAVRGAATALERVAGASAARHPSYRAALVEAAVYLNAAITAFDVRREVDRLGGNARPGRLWRLRPGPAAGPRRPAGAGGDGPGPIPVFADVPERPRRLRDDRAPRSPAPSPPGNSGRPTARRPRPERGRGSDGEAPAIIRPASRASDQRTPESVPSFGRTLAPPGLPVVTEPPPRSLAASALPPPPGSRGLSVQPARSRDRPSVERTIATRRHLRRTSVWIPWVRGAAARPGP